MVRRLLRDRLARRQGIAGLVAQLTQAAAGLGIILVVREAGGSLSLAGASAGAFLIATGAARPVQGRLMDRHGPPPVLIPCALLHLAGIAGLIGWDPGRGRLLACPPLRGSDWARGAAGVVQHAVGLG